MQFDLLAHDAEINAALSPFLRDIFTWINELGKIRFNLFVSVAVHPPLYFICTLLTKLKGF